MKLKTKLLSVLLLSVFTFYSCDDFSEIDAPIQNSTSGTANFSRFVSLGNSITAGYQSGTIYQSGQMYSYGNLIAQQVGTPYEIPYVSDPGLGGRLEIESLPPTFQLYTNPNIGTFLNANYPAPYNNLGIPGIILPDVFKATTAESFSKSPYIDIILRGKGSPIQQALSLTPTFITVWLGNNDILGYATTGGTTPHTPTANFSGAYTLLGQTLSQYASQTGAKVVVANIPSVTAIPFFTTVGPQMAAGIPWAYLSSVGAPGLFIQKHGEIVNPTSFTDSISLANLSVLITLKGSTYASPLILGQPGGKFYRDFKYPGLPTGIDTTKPFGFHPQNPWPDALILDAGEITVAQNTVTTFNGTIATVANANGFGLVDVNTIFNQIRQNDAAGTVINGIKFRTTYVSGGLFSLDGVHPSSQAHGIIANEFIKAINIKFGAKIPLIDVSSIPGSHFFMSKITYKQGYPIIPLEVFDHLLF